MASLESAYFTVEKLVENFKANESHYTSQAYSEIDARRDFIDKFFEALGWDVYHNEQKNPYEQEVKVERNVAVGAAQKRADYAFYIKPNHRDPVFYVEAKKPARNLFNADDYFQAIRYGWNTSMPVVVLTDFEEFHIIDSRYKPNIKSALDFKLKKYLYTDYTDKEKFAEIYYLFSRESVGNDSINKYAERLKKPRGGVQQRNLFSGSYKSIDESFLEELDDIRNVLAKSFKRKNPALTSEELTEATQRTIDRLVFLRFLEDKLIEGESHIDNYGAKQLAWKEFISDSKSLNAKYNGVVFRTHPIIDSDKFNPPDDKDFATICEELSFKNSPYHFNLIPIHILGSIYERFLGKVVHATAKQVKIEEKPEVRKAGGVYYTPQYIVQYIVDNTVGKIIEGKTPQEISKLRFADISCGSGSFLITVYDTLLHYYSKWYQQNPEQAKKDGCIEKEGSWILSLNQKKDILLNNIYGVDIDYQAVEVTQLSLYLKLLEDESQASIVQEELFYKNKKVLPELSSNIVCGNSLIGTDFSQGGLFISEDMRKINAMNFEDRFPEIMKNGGFDAIVGNPPYITLSLGKKQRFFNDFELNYFNNKYKRVAEYKGNTFSLFIAKSLEVIRTKGFVSMIVPSTLLLNSTFRNLREFILSNSLVIELIHINQKVFKDAELGGSLVFVFVKEPNIKIHNVRVIDIENDCENTMKNLNFTLTPQANYKTNSDFKFHTLNRNSSLLDKVNLNSLPLGEIVKFYQGIITGDNKKYLSTAKLDSRYSKIIRGKDITRYGLTFNNNYILFDKKLLWSNTDERFFKSKEKIINRQTGDSLIAALDINGYFTLDSTHVQVLRDNMEYSIKYILGLFNSKLINFIYKESVQETGRIFAQVKIIYLKTLPIKIIHFMNEAEKTKHDMTVFLVDKMLEAKKQLVTVTTDKDKTYYENLCSTLDRQIDQLVYELYGLTEEEIKIVEGEA